MSTPDVSPSRWYYALAFLALLAGIAIFAWSIFTGISSISDELVQVAAPGKADLDLQEPGSYTIFYENQSYFNGSFYYAGEGVPELQFEIIELSTGASIATYAPSGSFTYSIGGRVGRSILDFQTSRPGIYRISTSYPDGSTEPKVVLAIGHGLLEDTLSAVLTSLAAFFGSIIIAAGMAIVIYRRRQRAFERLREEERLIRGKDAPK
jgi:hypothetical protein